MFPFPVGCEERTDYLWSELGVETLQSIFKAALPGVTRSSVNIGPNAVERTDLYPWEWPGGQPRADLPLQARGDGL